ncbi:MAG: hypothetical protein DHS20C12_21320 [Pseudohongiella sp.]|nr:MAG: hypothetical protein DHS20C12_21320 [Pseudohongiella sp.]
MKMTIAEALQKGIDAHKAGQAQEADKFYTAILKEQPKNPDANHNIGVLAVSLGKIQQALPYFQTALETSTPVDQYWLSYIDALVKLDRLAEANDALEQAISSGGNGEVFEPLARRISEREENNQSIAPDQDPTQENFQRLVNLYNRGQLLEALSATKELLEQHPNSAVLLNVLGAVFAALKQSDAAIDSYKRALRIKPDFAEAHNNLGVILLDTGELEAAINSYRLAIEIKDDYAEAHNNLGNALRVIGDLKNSKTSCMQALRINPNLAEAHNNLGNTQRDLGDLDGASSSYRQAATVKPEYAEAHNNLGAVLHSTGESEAAIESYGQALKYKPDYAEPYYNKAITLQELGNLEAAIESYLQALKIQPSNPDAHNNIGICLQELGRIDEAKLSYKKALSIAPDHADSFINLKYIQIQISAHQVDPDERNNRNYESLQENLAKSPKYQVYQAISYYLLGEFNGSKECIDNYRKMMSRPPLHILDEKQRIFCNAYTNFIDELIVRNTFLQNPGNKFIYHIGESHCLSYAHLGLTKEEVPYTVAPRITFGAKAHHFALQEENIYKAITRINLRAMPNRSQVFISIGEIDCRITEGIILASTKNGNKIEEIVSNTVKGFVSWFLAENIDKQHDYFFLSVPAPTYLEEHSLEDNAEAARVVSLFNSTLRRELSNSRCGLIDVYELTKSEEGFSNGVYHCDKRHLDGRILNSIQKQWLARL